MQRKVRYAIHRILASRNIALIHNNIQVIFQLAAPHIVHLHNALLAPAPHEHPLPAPIEIEFQSLIRVPIPRVRSQPAHRTASRQRPHVPRQHRVGSPRRAEQDVRVVRRRRGPRQLRHAPPRARLEPVHARRRERALVPLPFSRRSEAALLSRERPSVAHHRQSAVQCDRPGGVVGGGHAIVVDVDGGGRVGTHGEDVVRPTTTTIITIVVVAPGKGQGGRHALLPVGTPPRLAQPRHQSLPSGYRRVEHRNGPVAPEARSVDLASVAGEVDDRGTLHLVDVVVGSVGRAEFGGVGVY
mmetsp:Transcript_13424/g.28828  ORF Transcript_13424/g.28828 Transcript_13424/m.28828 type:complete len:299 (+) Transcript_13424:263-1159(+)